MLSKAPTGQLEVTTLEQLSQRTQNPTSILQGQYPGKIVFVDGDLEIFGSLDLNKGVDIPGFSVLASEELKGLWVSGNLTIQGSIANSCGDYGRFLVVEGKTEAEHIIGGGSEIYLFGGTHAKGLVIGHYNHGILKISERLRAQLILNDDHDMSVPAQCEGLQLNDDPFDALYFTSADYTAIFLPEFVEVETFDEDDDGEDDGDGDYDDEPEVYLKLHALIDALLSGKEVLQVPLPTSSRRWLQVLEPDEGRSDGLVADFEGVDVREVPEGILRNERVTALDFTNNDFSEIPDSLSEMPNLQILDFSGNPLRTLPMHEINASLHTLLLYDQDKLSLDDVAAFVSTQPTIRSVGYSAKRRLDFDQTISQMSQLVEELDELKRPFENVKANGVLRMLLRTLFSKKARDANRAAMDEFVEATQKKMNYPVDDILAIELPASLSTMEELYIHDTRLASIEFTQPTTELHTLSLDGSVHALENQPDWQQFPNLLQLDLSLNRRWAAGQADIPLLESLADLPPGLEQLTLDHWLSFEPAVAEAIMALPNTLTRLRKLKSLSLVRTRVNVRDLISALADLQALEEIDIEGIALSRSERKKLEKSLPQKCKIID
jgi:Leucine-rich repeat (LRR) protein